MYYYAEMALPEEPTNALFQRDSPLTTSDAYDLLVGEDDCVNRLPFRPTGGASDLELDMSPGSPGSHSFAMSEKNPS